MKLQDLNVGQLFIFHDDVTKHRLVRVPLYRMVKNEYFIKYSYGPDIDLIHVDEFYDYKVHIVDF